VPVDHKGVRLECGYRIDLVVDEAVIHDLKGVKRFRAYIGPALRRRRTHSNARSLSPWTIAFDPDDRLLSAHDDDRRAPANCRDLRPVHRWHDHDDVAEWLRSEDPGHGIGTAR